MATTEEVKKITDFIKEHNISEFEAATVLFKMLAGDPRLSDNFETALAALIEHHGADALTALSAVMRCHDLQLIPSIDGLAITNMTDLIKEVDSPSTITANDIKPEK